MADSNLGSYAFKVSSSQQPKFIVGAVEGKERIGEPYYFDIDLISSVVGLNLEELMGKSATLTINPPWNGKSISYHGIVTQAQSFSETLDKKMHYRLRVEPTITKLKQTILNYVYTNTTQAYTLSSLLTAVFNRYSLQSGTNYQINLNPPIESRPFIMQYEESDFDFMQRWLEYEGAFYYFKQGSSCEEMVIIDDNMSFPTSVLNMKYIQQGSMNKTEWTEVLMSFNATQSLNIKTVQLRDYNYLRAQDIVNGKKQNGKALWGEQFIFGGNLLTNSNAKNYAELRSEAACTYGMVVQGKTMVTGIMPGTLISVSNHPDKSLNKQFRVVAVHHTGRQEGFGINAAEGENLSTDDTNFYMASIEVIPSDVQFRLPLKTPRPKISGFLPGVIDGDGNSEIPQLDDKGRYKVKFPFASNSYSPGKASSWIRMATNYGGGGEQGNSGLSFPLLIGTEVMLTFNNGDPDLPEIAGAFANSLTPNTVNNLNPSVNQMISHAGNQLQLDDTANTSGVRFLSNEGSMLLLGAFGGQFGTPSDKT